MSGSYDDRSSGSFEQTGAQEVMFHLGTAHRMLSLVRKIVDDLVSTRKRLDRLLPEQERLDRKRHSLAWPDRQRRYQVKEEAAGLEQHFQEILAELEVLGVVLLNAAEGRVGFPTIINQRPAYFAWCPEDDGLHYWQFPGESTLRPIPTSWREDAEINLSGKR